MTDETNLSSFDDLGLSPELLQTIQEIGYENPSPIQAACIPHLLEGRDLIGQAQTGTGKTAAFALPVLNRIDIERRAPQALVLAPTRELAIQVAEAFQTYARHLEGFHILPIYGGQGMNLQLRHLARGVHVVVGTPGRVMDHLRRGTLNLDSLTTLVLDEADEMLRMGFIEDVEWILEHTPDSRQTALFSATMPPVIRKIADGQLRNPVEVKIKAKTATVESINQQYWLVSGLQKLEALTRILDAEDIDAMIIFVRTKTETVELAEKLEARGYEAAALNGDMSQVLREKVIDRLKKGGLDIVIATDVAARGLDVDRITHVVNYDIPYDTEAYVHRIGRTGRAGRKGTAILFVAPRERRMLRAIEQATRQPIQQMRLPTLQDIADRRIEQFKAQLVEVLDNEDIGFYRELIDQMVTEELGEAADIAAAIAHLMHRERPLAAPDEPEPPVREFRDFDRGDRDRGSDRRPERRDRDDRRRDTEPMRRYTLDVGREHGVTPRDIVGALANEGGIPARRIGQIKLHDTHSTVELPEDLPGDCFARLKKTWVRNQRINLQPEEGGGDRPPRKPLKLKDGDNAPFRPGRRKADVDVHLPKRKPNKPGRDED
ncbi:DEAD/DEAH box helicase [Methylomagnum ishizawai]|uniref:DEAD/DEAH box helicase n=1 Tax=Methylomagnum ishizawai TaxID=1760988 RepID=UPI001C32F95E|nr:DEAD/DEAH box helicase [Methylomagnum ishizawai]BBL75175.1 ATP-dependent RNA helicase DeaD [Methylomagnum ishizawai]